MGQSSQRRDGLPELPEVECTVRMLRRVLRDAIEALEAGRRPGYAVCGRAGEPCLRCGSPLVKVKLGGRGTTFCPACQEIP